MKVALLCGFARGLACFQRLLEMPVDVSYVFVYPEDPHEVAHSQFITELAKRRGIGCRIARNVGAADHEVIWERGAPHLVLVIGWRSLIPTSILRRPQLGSVAIHDSLLPRYRGFAPVNWALINGERETGATMFYLVEEMDAGDIIDQRSLVIGPDDDAQTLAERMIPQYVDMVSVNVPLILEGKAPRRPQNHNEANYGIWRTPEDGLIDWSLPAARIHDLVRGLAYPYPGAYTFLDGQKLTIWKSRLSPEGRLYAGGGPGKVERLLPGVGVNVLTGAGILTLLEVQIDGQTRAPAAHVIRRLKTRLG